MVKIETSTGVWVEVSDAGHVQGGKVIDPDAGKPSEAALADWEIPIGPVPGIEAAR